MGAQVYSQTMERLHCSVPPPVKICHRQSPAKTRLTRTKRNLFGAVKSDEVKQIYVAQMQLQANAKNEKWNFDFRKGKPMEGTMQWEPVGVKHVPMLMLTQAAHVPVSAVSFGLQRARSAASDDCLSSDELMDERAERGNRVVGVDVDTADESQSSTPSTLSPVQVAEKVQTYPVPSSSRQRTASPKPSSSKGSEMRQPKITEFLKERKRRLSSTVPVEKISAKKVRMMLATSATSGNGIGQQQEEVSSSSEN